MVNWSSLWFSLRQNDSIKDFFASHRIPDICKLVTFKSFSHLMINNELIYLIKTEQTVVMLLLQCYLEAVTLLSYVGMCNIM